MSCSQKVLLCIAVGLGTACGTDPALLDAGPAPDGGDSAVLDAGPAADGGDSAVDAAPRDASTDGPAMDALVPMCVDEDEDGYGAGCDLGADCDDADPAVSPGNIESCNGGDDDCDGLVDEALTGPPCPLAQGVCTGATARCESTGFVCDDRDYGARYQRDETSCDGLDNDCDGSTDEGCSCVEGATLACGSAEGACVAGVQRCVGGSWSACAGGTGPMGESCNGLDDDCDGTADEASELVPPDCPLQLGVCAGSKRRCGGVAGFIACTGVESYGGDFQSSETLCDGLDNDCDGVVDEGCSCIDGTSQTCGSDLGACRRGLQTCASGMFGTCAGEVGPAVEICNGIDDDCDGSTDEDVLAPPCALAAGVCVGSRQSCGGASGFAACTPGSYGTSYELTETRCDGLDNDCDGVVDEGCSCIDGTTQQCGSSVGSCSRGTQTCAGGVFGACIGGTGPAVEVCNGLDDNCDGRTDEGFVCSTDENTAARCVDGIDNDGDGFVDCDDFGCSRNPAVTVCVEATSRLCTDGFDNDGDGFIDCQDWGCSRNPAVTVCAEITASLCTDGIDNDGNGFTDCEDWGCSRNPSVTVCRENTDALCSDGLDNDRNGMTDCADTACLGPSVTVCP